MKNTYLILIALVVSFTTLNAQWVELVTPTINGEIKYSSFIDLEINLEGEPYLFYDVKVPSDNGKDYEWKLFVQKYNMANEEWSLVGDSYINELSAEHNHIEIDSEDNIYVSYLKYDSSGEDMRCRIKKFDGTDWVLIGDWNATIYMSDVAMYCDNQDNIYVTYWDLDTYSGQVVKRYLGTGSEWETLGDEPFLLSTQCFYPALTTDNDGNVLVSFLDGLAGWHLSVKKFNGSNWEYVGNPGFWDEPDSPTSIIVGHDDMIHATTIDFWTGGSTVLNYENNAWQDQYISYAPRHMPFTKSNNDLYMGHAVNDNGTRIRIKKIDNSGTWVDLPEQPDQNYTTPFTPHTYFDIEADNYENLYLAFYKEVQWNNHVTVLKLDIATGISEPQIENNAIYPNPTNGIINISIPPGEHVNRVIVTDISGKIVFQDENENPVIDLSILENGVYFVRVNTSENTYIEKVIIQ